MRVETKKETPGRVDVVLPDILPLRTLLHNLETLEKERLAALVDSGKLTRLTASRRPVSCSLSRLGRLIETIVEISSSSIDKEGMSR